MREPGPRHGFAERKTGQVTAWGAPDESGATNARVVPVWQDPARPVLTPALVVPVWQDLPGQS
jgi:hypothetical protein